MKDNYQNTIRNIFQYCKQRIEESGEDFEFHKFIALHIINEDKYSLQKADKWLYDRMTRLIQEYCNKNNLAAQDYNTEEVFTKATRQEE